jgi:hypothetical protein
LCSMLKITITCPISGDVSHFRPTFFASNLMMATLPPFPKKSITCAGFVEQKI